MTTVDTRCHGNSRLTSSGEGDREECLLEEAGEEGAGEERRDSTVSLSSTASSEGFNSSTGVHA